MLIDFHTHKPTAEGVITPRSFGIHPWHADTEQATDFECFFTKYQTQFEEAEIIGECGLDKACSCDWNRQLQLFEWQIRIADLLHKPMVIHCVRAFNEVMAIKKIENEEWKIENSKFKIQNSKFKNWVVHGFTGSAQLAEQLYRHGIMVSYGAALLDPRRAKVHESLQQNKCPWFLETDDCDCGIEAVYKAAAKILGTDVEAIFKIQNSNFKIFK